MSIIYDLDHLSFNLDDVPPVQRTGKGAVRLDEKLGESLVRGGVADALRSKVMLMLS